MASSKIEEIDIPQPSLDVMEYRRADIKSRENDLGSLVRAVYGPLLQAYRDEVQQYFQLNFGSNIDPETKQATWDLVKAKQLRTLEDLGSSFDELTLGAEDTLTEDFNQHIGEAFDQGYDTSLWELNSLGIDLGDTTKVSGKAKTALIMAAAIGGLSYLDRLSQWSQTASGKMKQSIKVAIASGQSLQDTLTTTDMVSQSLVNRVVSLGENELNRAYLLATEVAREPYQDQLQEVWLTRRDADVCPFCAELDLTITTLQPIAESHPGCRCQKVLLVDAIGNPIDYISFLTSIGRR